MLSTEQQRQMGCVVNRLVALLEKKAKGRFTVHLDGGGNIGQQFEEDLMMWRDRFSSEKMGIPVEESEFLKIVRHSNKEV